ncbi:choice-of-anchor M domain-containing protein [Corynebacterium tapiri]|uniref:Cell surface protein n=1 Tax=Corynebacterium tapiri TaxID=1448266 RepID=A0A5C4U6Z1_9CORY|nr:choice-of-anchor M domain-containing protein [Corynebacterium tapiri]TNL99445.1 hypothetical protein FHE74_03595 [Corynebacterium tapiri]
MITQSRAAESHRVRSNFFIAFLTTLALMIAGAVAPAHVAHADELKQYEGRDLLFKNHVDAAHVYEEGSDLKVGVIEGEKTLRKAEDVIVRLGPDATSSGEEMSRIVVPDKQEYSFLGKPGDVLWHATQRLHWYWPSVWPGIGAGDISEAFQADSLELHSAGIDGPGDVEVYFAEYNSEPRRVFSSTDPNFQSKKMKPREHGHFNWAFTEPGRYTFKYYVTAKRADGSEYKSDEYHIEWFVGTDKQVDLPEGSWQPLNEIQKFVAPLDGYTDEQGNPIAKDSSETSESTPPSKPSEKPSKPAEPSEPEEPSEPSEPAAPNGEEKLILDEGHTDIFSVSASQGGNPVLELSEDVTGSHVKHKPEDVELHIKSDALTTIPDKFPGAGQAYFLSETQKEGLIWPGWDTQGIRGSGLDNQIDLRFTNVEGPGTINLWSTKGFGEVASLLDGDATELTSGAVLNQKMPSHTHANWAFSEPGVYRLTVQAAGTRNGQEVLSEPAVYTFTVGDEFRGTEQGGGDASEAPSEEPSEPAPQPSKPAKPQPAPDAPIAKHKPHKQPSLPGKGNGANSVLPSFGSSQGANGSLLDQLNHSVPLMIAAASAVSVAIGFGLYHIGLNKGWFK